MMPTRRCNRVDVMEGVVEAEPGVERARPGVLKLDLEIGGVGLYPGQHGTDESRSDPLAPRVRRDRERKEPHQTVGGHRYAGGTVTDSAEVGAAGKQWQHRPPQGLQVTGRVTPGASCQPIAVSLTGDDEIGGDARRTLTDDLSDRAAHHDDLRSDLPAPRSDRREEPGVQCRGLICTR